jgi:hypothetical protein
MPLQSALMSFGKTDVRFAAVFFALALENTKAKYFYIARGPKQSFIR